MNNIATASLTPTLNGLQQALDSNDDDSITEIIHFVQAISQFSNNDRPTAIALLTSTFWTEKPNNQYVFTNRFKLLTAKNLAIIIKNLGNTNIVKHIFHQNCSSYLIHYPIDDLIRLLSMFYSDYFANFIFNNFKGGYLKANLSSRIQYIKSISTKCLIMILKEGNIGKSLTNSELIQSAIKMKKYLIAKSNNNPNINNNVWLDVQKILPEIIQLIITKGIKSLTVNELKSICDNDLIITMDQSKTIINELLNRQNKLSHQIIGSGSGGSITSPNDIKNRSNCRNLIGLLSTSNFAVFQRPMKPINNNNHPLNARVVLDGPLVTMPMDDKQNNDDDGRINYSVLIQIQDLNPLFNNDNDNNGNTNKAQPKGCIFVILTKQIPSNYEISLSVSRVNESLRKELNIGMNNGNPVTIVPWPVPKLGRVVSFQLHCQLRYSQKNTNNIIRSIRQIMINPNSINDDQKINNNNNNDNDNDANLWSITGNKMVMCIYSGQNAFNNNNNNNSNRVPWINVVINNKMKFIDMIDSACAQLALPPPYRKNNNNKQQQQQQQIGIFGGFNDNNNNNQCNKYYIIRNQMGHHINLNQNVIKYLNQMVMNSNLFPVFVFTTTKKPQKNQNQFGRGRGRGRGGGGGFGALNLNFNPSINPNNPPNPFGGNF